jgi:hypothetical protein
MLSSEMLSQITNGATVHHRQNKDALGVNTVHHRQNKDALGVNTYYRKSLLSL